MKKKYIIASAALGAILLASPAYADDKGKNDDGEGLKLGRIVRVLRDDERREHKEERRNAATSTVAIHGTVTAISGTSITLLGKNAAVYTVNAATAVFEDGSLASIAVGDFIKVKGTINGSTIAATKIEEEDEEKHKDPRGIFARLGELRTGIVTAVTPTGFTIARFGTGTTTVTTNASTTVKAPGKNASTTIAVGTRVIVAGATSTADTLSANFVIVLNKGFSWFKHWFGR